MNINRINNAAGAYKAPVNKKAVVLKKAENQEIKDKVTISDGKKPWSMSGGLDKAIGTLAGAYVGTIGGAVTGAIAGGVIGASMGGPLGAALGAVGGILVGGAGGMIIGARIGGK